MFLLDNGSRVAQYRPPQAGQVLHGERGRGEGSGRGRGVSPTSHLICDNTVEPLNNGANSFVPCREVVPISEVE